MNLLKRYYPFIFIFIVWVIFSSPYFVKGNLPYSSSYQVNHFMPWSAYEKYWGPVKNGAMPDITDQIIPWRHFTVEQLKKLEIPLWNPYSFSGNPHLANFQSAALSPFNIIFLILPFADAWSINVLLQPLLAGIFTLLLMKQFRSSNNAAIISSVTFMFCGFITTWMAYGTLSMAIAFLPVSLYAVEKFFEKKSFLLLLIFSITIPVSFFSGHFQTSLYFALFIFCFILFKAISTKNKRSSLIVFAYFIFGIFLSMPQLIPSVEFYFNSVRSDIFISGGGIPLHYLVTSFVPDFFGNPVTRNDWMGNYAEWASFVGIIPLSLVFIQIVTKFKEKKTLFFIIAGVVVLVLAVDSPIQQLLGQMRIPVLSTSNPSRIIVLFSFCLAILSGFGLDSLQDYYQKKSYKKILPPLFMCLVMIIFIWGGLLFLNWIPIDKVSIAKRNLILPTLLFACLLFSLLLSLTVKKNNLSKKIIFVIVAFIVFAASFDSLRFAQKWMPFDSRNLFFPEVQVISAIKSNIGNGRIFGNLGGQVETYYGISSVQGYDPLYINSYGQFIQYSNYNKLEKAQRSVVQLSKTSPNTDRVLSLLGVNLIFHPIADTNQGWAFPVWGNPQFVRIYNDDRFELYKNTFSFEREKLFFNYEIINNKNKELKRMFDASFDYKNNLILEEKPKFERIDDGKGTSRIISYKPNNILIKTVLQNPALLYLSDNYYPGWKVFVDNKETNILRANYSFRAVEVPDGEHMVKFEYRPFSFRIGIYMAILGIVFIFGFYKARLTK